jgi:hypothetical protein
MDFSFVSILPDQSHHNLRTLYTQELPFTVGLFIFFFPMASSHISMIDRLDSDKYRTWLKTISNECLQLEYQSTRSKHLKYTMVVTFNCVSAVFTVPVTVGFAAIAHVAVHLAAQAKRVIYASQFRSCGAEVKRRGLIF